MNLGGVLYWITGLSGAGKTTIGTQLYYKLRQTQNNVVLLDGDILKQIVGEDLGYTKEERRERAIRYSKLCKMLTDQGQVVICCTIAMFDEVREWNRKNNKGYVEVFLDVPLDVLVKRDQKGMYSKYKQGNMKNLVGVDMGVELPECPDIRIVNDGNLTVNECVDQILNCTISQSELSNFDVEYWNQYYKKKCTTNAPSRFAEYVGTLVQSGKSLLELGCGNGRDSLYFNNEIGLEVTAVDSAQIAIQQLSEENKDSEELYFICDDFVCSKMLYKRQYDYCYSRFTMHAINEAQQKELLGNVYDCIKKDGYFFIEVRSVNDELYGKGEYVGKNAYVYNDHYRRFLVMEELQEELKNLGFEIFYAKEDRGFAPFGDSDPYIIRIVAKKTV